MEKDWSWVVIYKVVMFLFLLMIPVCFILGQTFGGRDVCSCFNCIALPCASEWLLEGLEVSKEVPATWIIHTQFFSFIWGIKENTPRLPLCSTGTCSKNKPQTDQMAAVRVLLQWVPSCQCSVMGALVLLMEGDTFRQTQMGWDSVGLGREGLKGKPGRCVDSDSNCFSLDHTDPRWRSLQMMTTFRWKGKWSLRPVVFWNISSASCLQLPPCVVSRCRVVLLVAPESLQEGLQF